MLDIKLIRDDVEGIIKKLSRRNKDFSYLREITTLDIARREAIQKADELKNVRNNESKKIGILKGKGEEVDHLFQEIAAMKDQIAAFDEVVKNIDKKIYDILANTPNIPDASIPSGHDETDNLEVRRHGTPRTFDFTPLPHWDLGTNLGYFDFERAAKVTGPRFTFYRGAFAKLERSIMMLMLDTHSLENGYQEILPPYMVNSDSMFGTGQLPKFAEDAFHLEREDYWMIPTAEVPVTNYFRDEILPLEMLPQKFCAYSSCFRAEAGSAGRDTRGIIRQHQFQKVELVKFVVPEDSMKELELLTNDAETILQKLELPYRVVCLSTGDVSFSSTKTYDLEVWLPSYNDYKEISSCSNFLDYQARRMNIKFKRSKEAKAEYLHTLNGSGLAIGRTVAAVIENYQQKDGTIKVPTVLQKYMGMEIIK